MCISTLSAVDMNGDNNGAKQRHIDEREPNGPNCDRSNSIQTQGASARLILQILNLLFHPVTAPFNEHRFGMM